MKVKQTYGKNITVEVDVPEGSKLSEVEVERLLAEKAAAIDWEKEAVCGMCPPYVETGEILKALEGKIQYPVTKSYRDL